MQRDDVHMYFGLKWNPFGKDIPVDGMTIPPRVGKFCWRVENLAHEGGYALITGAPGLGKSVALRILEDRLSKLRELQVGVILRPQSRLADFLPRDRSSFRSRAFREQPVGQLSRASPQVAIPRRVDPLPSRAFGRRGAGDADRDP